MSCEVTRRQLLGVDNPRRPPAALRPHLTSCSACRDWLRKLAEIEAQIPLLPVPSSEEAKDRFLRELREPPLVPESMRVVAPELPFMPPKERGLLKAAFAVALAAAVVFFAVGLWAWPRHSEVPGENPAKQEFDLVAWKKQQRDEFVARAPTPLDKVQVLADFADNVLREAREGELPAPERLQLLARIYKDTLEEMIGHARASVANGPISVAKVELPRLASRLSRTESEFERLAAGAPKAAADHLRNIAAAAKRGERSLRELVNA